MVATASDLRLRQSGTRLKSVDTDRGGWSLEGERVCLCDLRGTISARAELIDDNHVRLLGDAEDLPPVLVHRTTMRVVDGVHRVEAARRRGDPDIAATFLEGTENDAFIEAVRANVCHGKPLSFTEREEAARRILASSPEWSDRRIASICVLSPVTVGKQRRHVAGAMSITKRIGRDGRLRPVDAAATRDNVARELVLHPDASPEGIAKQLGASPTTVRAVRRHGPRSQTPPTDLHLRTSQAPEPLGVDPAFISATDSKTFARWFDRNTIQDSDWETLLNAIPLSRIYQVIDEARRRSGSWTRLAQTLEQHIPNSQ